MAHDNATILANLNSRITALENHINTSLRDYQIKTQNTNAAYIASITTCQSILFKQLIKLGVLKREEMGLMFDTIISEISSKYPNNTTMTKHMTKLRDDINKADPYSIPDTFRDFFGDTDPQKHE